MRHMTVLASDVCFYDHLLSQNIEQSEVILSFVLIHSTARISVYIFTAMRSKLFSMHHRPLVTKPEQSTVAEQSLLLCSRQL